MNKDEIHRIIDELLVETKGKLDGGRKNIVADCPWCGKKQKYGIRIAPDQGRRKQFMSHCFSCGRTTMTLNDLLDLYQRPDLKVADKVETTLEDWEAGNQIEEEELDDTLVEVELPEGYKQCKKNQYLKSREYTERDYTYFPVGTTRGLNFKYDDYVIFPIVDCGKNVGFVSRHIWPKDKIEEYNRKQSLRGGFQIQRYKNSYGEGYNDFQRLLYNIDNVIQDETDTVILCEGIFDVIALTRKLMLYDNHRIAAVATFGKKISDVQAYRLQAKGVRTIVIGYDNDAEDGILSAADFLSSFFDVFIAPVQGDGKDWDDADFWDIYDAFASNLMTPFEFRHQL